MKNIFRLDFNPDFPLDRDLAARITPWVLGLLFYLAVIALASAFATNKLVREWGGNLAGRLTIEIPPSPEAKNQHTARQIEDIIMLLKGTPGIQNATLVPKETLNGLLEPWLGRGNVAEDLPLPTLIDVEIIPNSKIDLLQLADQLVRLMPGIRVQDHATWHAPVLKLASSIQIFSLWLTLMIILACIATVVFICYTAMLTHQNVVRILQLVGAPGSYLANQFMRHMMHLGSRAAVMGAVMAVITLALLKWLFLNDSQVPGTALKIDALSWLMVVVIPLMLVGLMMQTARLTVLWNINHNTFQPTY